MEEDYEKKPYIYLENNWFCKGYKYYNYFDVFDNKSLVNILQHFFSTNNIEESLNSKLNLYLIAKKND